MKRTSILLPDDLAALLEHERRRRDVPAATIVREALAEYLTNGRGASGERRFSFIGIGRSGQEGKPGIAASMEELLGREWSGDDLGGSRGR